MPGITLSKLQDIMRECAGEDDAAPSMEESAHLSFEDLGYDSLALLETQSRISQEYGVALPEEDLADIRTPQALVEYVNGRIAQAA
ncbi:acyl carrier protein [Streptomyces sp. CA2R101]|uniref:acyl carrier protein n=1 Tax=Streptomyces sp. CA2R101 TaxID=3120152 RepID=UPI00300BB115